MKFIKKLLLIIIIAASMFSEVKATTLGPIDVLGYPSQGPAVDTLRNAFNYFASPEAGFFRNQFFIRDNFYSRGFVFTIPIHKEKQEMHYKLWLQLEPAPLVTIVPGLGSLYNEQTLMVLANMFFKSGYSVLAISNPFNWEFMQSAASVPTPGYTIRDSQDTYYALYRIISHLKEKYGKRITDNVVIGYSLGAMYTIFISILDEKYSLINYSKYVAVNPPLNLIYGTKVLDSYFNIIDSWPRTKLKNKATKALVLFNKLIKKKINIDKKLPIDSEEAQYIIGLSFHNSLVEMLASIAQRQKGGGLFLHEFNYYNRDSLYRELNSYNYTKYIKLLVLPYYTKLFGQEVTFKDLNQWASLTNYDKYLKNNQKIRVIHNINDFLLTEEDKIWFEEVFGNRLVYFSHGGHIGNMFFPEVQKFILEASDPHNHKVFNGKEVKRIKGKALQSYLKQLTPEERKAFKTKAEKISKETI
ncbi:MAG: hypothetical protein K9M56_02610 [Victivallales bacterium]|nr:hypothetical protein [Victivallales bacterium]